MEQAANSERKIVKMDINSWIKEILGGEAELGGVSEKQVRVILRHLFLKVNDELGAIESSGSFRMSGLGKFRIVLRQKQGQTELSRQIHFAPETEGRWKDGKDSQAKAPDA